MNILIQIPYVLSGFVFGLLFFFVAYITTMLIANLLKCLSYNYNSHPNNPKNYSQIKKYQRKHDYVSSEALINDSTVEHSLLSCQLKNAKTERWDFFHLDTLNHRCDEHDGSTKWCGKQKWKFLLDDTIEWFAEQKKEDDIHICKLEKENGSKIEKSHANQANCNTQRESSLSPRTSFLKEIPYWMNKNIVTTDEYYINRSVACIPISNEDNNEIE